MRIVIDMQAAQMDGRNPLCSARETLSLAQALARGRGEHEVYLALSGLFPASIEAIRLAFEALLPQENIRVWYAPGPVDAADPDNQGRRKAAQLIREAFLAALQPDLLLVPDVLLGYGNEGVVSLDHGERLASHCLWLNSAVLSAAAEQSDDEGFQGFFQEQLGLLRRADGCITDSVAAVQALLGGTWASVDSLFEVPMPARLADGGQAAGFAADPPRSAPVAGDCYWDNVAEPVMAALLALRQGKSGAATRPLVKPRLAYVSPVPPARTGIADYSAELLPALAALYEVDLIVDQSTVSPEIAALAKGVHDWRWFRAHASEYDRVLYQIGNSSYHRYMLSLLQEIPGTVVLHDFFLSHLMAEVQHRLGGFRLLYEALYDAHGYRAIIGWRSDHREALRAFPVNYFVLQNAQGLIVHSEHSRQLMRDWYGRDFSARVVPHLRSLAAKRDVAAARQRLGIAEDAFVVCSFGGINGYKLHHELIAAWSASRVAADPNSYLILVGDNQGQFGRQIQQLVAKSPVGKNIRMTGHATRETYENHLQAADLAVQLRAHSRGETSGAVLDCMGHGVPVIANSNGSLAELDRQAVWLLPDAFEVQELVTALDSLWASPEQRRQQVEAGRRTIESAHLPAVCAEQYRQAIEWAHLKQGSGGRHGLERALLPYGMPSADPEPFEARRGFVLHDPEYSADPGAGLPASRVQICWEAVTKGGLRLLTWLPRRVLAHYRLWQGRTWFESTAPMERIRRLARRRAFGKSLPPGPQPGLDESVTLSLGKSPSNRQLLVDITATCQNDLKTGIERVARALLLAWLKAPPAGWRVEPVYLCNTGGLWHYRYARRYALELTVQEPSALDDEWVVPNNGDRLIGLDISGDRLIQAEAQGLFQSYRDQGVQVYFMVHDLLPISMPEVFPPGAGEGHARWLRAVARQDGVVCVSEAVATDFVTWQQSSGIDYAGRRPFRVAVSHHGADIDNSSPSAGLPRKAHAVLAQLKKRPTVLMVGTIEPRKGYLQVIEAFDLLWKAGLDINLVIVGPEGWRGLPDKLRRDIPQTTARLRAHPEKGKRLFWLRGISDEYLELIYASSTCLLAASFGEGFGLPLIEAARKGKPIIARDIPVFREVAGAHADYFEGGAKELAAALSAWLQGDHQRADQATAVAWKTWAQSASTLSAVLLEPQEQRHARQTEPSSLERL